MSSVPMPPPSMMNPAIDAGSAMAPRSAVPALWRRLLGALVACSSLSVLLVAAWLEPSPTGLGTHQQIPRMVACPWITFMDLPCPTCGMTTAFAHAADGHVLAALHAQPLGGLLAIAAAMLVLLGAHVAVTGSRIGSGLLRLWRPRCGWALAALVVVAWFYKIASYRGWLP